MNAAVPREGEAAEPTAPRICVVGAGAIGGWLAARLALAGEAVSVLARGATLQALQQRGLELRSQGERQVVPVRAADTAEALGPQDIVLLTVKAPALPALAPRLAPLLHPGTRVLSAANGLPWWYFLAGGRSCAGLRLRSVDAEGGTEAALPQSQVLGLSVFAACHCPAPGVVQHDSGGRLLLGEPAGGSSPRVQALAQRLKGAGLDAQVSEDIRRDIWLKLLGNACFNPVSLLTGAHTDDMIDTPELHALFVRMMDELLGIGGRIGLALDIEPARRIAQARALGHIKTSMLQDFEAGRPVEIGAILGAVLECAAAAAMPVPALATIHGLARLRAQSSGVAA